MDRMSFNPALLEIGIPTRPDALVKLAQLLAKDDVDLGALASLIEADMALAAAVSLPDSARVSRGVRTDTAA